MDFTNRQVEIIEAATRLIGDKGVHSMTTKALAKEMSFSEPALYRHFKNKVEILKSVLLYYKNNMGTTVFPILEENISGKEKMKKLMNFQFSHFSKNPAVVLVIFSETSFQDNKILANTVLSLMEQKQMLIETILEFGQMDGSVRKDIDKSQLAVLIMGSMRLTILRWRLSNFSHDLVEEGDKLWSTIELLIQRK